MLRWNFVLKCAIQVFRHSIQYRHSVSWLPIFNSVLKRRQGREGGRYHSFLRERKLIKLADLIFFFGGGRGDHDPQTRYLTPQGWNWHWLAKFLIHGERLQTFREAWKKDLCVTRSSGTSPHEARLLVHLLTQKGSPLDFGDFWKGGGMSHPRKFQPISSTSLTWSSSYILNVIAFSAFAQVYPHTAHTCMHEQILRTTFIPETLYWALDYS